MTVISENIKKYRIENRLTQELLAGKVGVTAQAVSKWECGDNIPDTTLLIPISNVLGISVDHLLGQDKVFENEIYRAIVDLIYREPKEKKAQKIRDFTWIIQKGWFKIDDQNDELIYPDYNKFTESSVISTDYGFSFLSNRKELTFYTFFLEPDEGFSSVLKYNPDICRIFEALGDDTVMKIFFYLYSISENYTFEKEVLAKQFELSNEKMDDVIEKLLRFCISKKEIVINDQMKTLYSCHLHHYELVAILAIMDEFVYHSKIFSMRMTNRKKFYLGNENKTINK
jgi:transcriptional regulator with XRE-family HTH domain